MKKLLIVFIFVFPVLGISAPGDLCPIPGMIAPKSLIELGRKIKRHNATEEQYREVYKELSNFGIEDILGEIGAEEDKEKKLDFNICYKFAEIKKQIDENNDPLPLKAVLNTLQKYKSSQGKRAGQYEVNRYIKATWPMKGLLRSLKRCLYKRKREYIYKTNSRGRRYRKRIYVDEPRFRKRSCPTPSLIKRRVAQIKRKIRKNKALKHHFKSHSPFIGGKKVIINNFDLTSDQKRMFIIDLEKGTYTKEKVSHGEGDGSQKKDKIRKCKAKRGKYNGRVNFTQPGFFLSTGYVNRVVPVKQCSKMKYNPMKIACMRKYKSGRHPRGRYVGVTKPHWPILYTKNGDDHQLHHKGDKQSLVRRLRRKRGTHNVNAVRLIGLEESNWFSFTDGVFVHGAVYNREKTQEEGQHIGTSHGCLAVDYDKAHKIFMDFHNPDKSNGHLVYNYIPVCDPKRKDQSTEDKLDPEVEQFMKDCALKQKQEEEAFDREVRERIEAEAFRYRGIQYLGH